MDGVVLSEFPACLPSASANSRRLEYSQHPASAPLMGPETAKTTELLANIPGCCSTGPGHSILDSGVRSIPARRLGGGLSLHKHHQLFLVLLHRFRAVLLSMTGTRLLSSGFPTTFQRRRRRLRDGCERATSALSV